MENSSINNCLKMEISKYEVCSLTGQLYVLSVRCVAFIVENAKFFFTFVVEDAICLDVVLLGFLCYAVVFLGS